MSFKNYLKEVEETKIFPSDEKIKEAVVKADAEFWKVIIEEFKDFTETDKINSSQDFTNAEQNAVKEWLKNNSNKDTKNLPKSNEPKNVPGGITKPLVTPYVGATVAGQEVRY